VDFINSEEVKDEIEKVHNAAWIIFRDVLIALAYMHQNNFIHWDVKLDNILFSKSDHVAKLTDFTVSKEL